MVKNFIGTDVRIEIKKGEPWFRASDVCSSIGLSNVSLALRSIENEDYICSINVVDAYNRKNAVWFISEPGLYELIFKSRRPEAKKFKEWVFSEVLPSIRKTGSYSIHPELRRESTKYRNELTEKWKESGIETQEEYRFLTIEEYRALHFPNGLRKKDMDKKQILLLMALESMEALKLHFNPKEGYFECEQSIYRTAGAVRKQIEGEKTTC
jgi:prophage antirepressor-like protein